MRGLVWRRCALVATATGILAGCNRGGDSRATTPSAGVRSISEADMRKAVLIAINQERAGAKLPPLRANKTLDEIAARRAKLGLGQVMKPVSAPPLPDLRQDLESSVYRARRFDEFQYAPSGSIPEFIKAWGKTERFASLMLNASRYSEIGVGRTIDNLDYSYYCLIFAEPWPKIEPDKAAKELVEAVNRARSKAGKTAVVADSALAALARAHVKAMATEKTTRPKGDDPAGRLAKSSDAKRFDTVGSSLIADVSTPEAAVDALLKKDPKNGPILDDRLTRAGAAVAVDDEGAPYWLILLGREAKGK